ncbi:beta-lactamase family protein [Blastococcus sp. TML/M2B]|uniref:serine hydrolase domain-containing protein n=1 Tax=unclassified Blastococcus TaxID=2619396 RepID=UPI00190A0CB2|nr:MULTISPECIES: serine hydrolase domain-containing protein [unclassified Blastococcus]MBN1093417.1 beta-lactamase family protein [Blastococcus sp. TML/M2B]MBN1096463.1 beta-lactamase family protein [Blastococcus sp. TML/C7B]
MTTSADPTATTRAAAGYLRTWLETQAAHRRVPGVQVAVRSGGELLLSAAVGVADAGTGAPLTTEHLFHVASHSKTFTATAVLQLVEAGRMRLDDPIGTHVPELAGSPLARATVRELLGHQSGVTRDGAHADFWQLEAAFPDRARLLDEVLPDGVVHGRNERFKYSNVGYALVGLAVEAVTGRPFAEHVRDAVLTPLGLTRTGADHDPARADEYAAGHTALLLGAQTRQVLGHAPTGAYAPATGFWSTAEELSAFAQAALVHGDERLIPDDAKRVMQRLDSVVTAYGKEVGRYGLGVDLSTVGERALVGHSGGWPGQITLTLADPTAGLVVSVLTNAIDGPAQELAHGLVALVDAALTPRAEVPPPPADAPPPSAFTGRFTGLWGVLDVAELGGRLVLLRPTLADPLHGMEEAQVVDDGTLRLAAQPGFGAAGELVRLERDGSGTVTAVRLGGVTHRRTASLPDALGR